MFISKTNFNDETSLDSPWTDVKVFGEQIIVKVI